MADKKFNSSSSSRQESYQVYCYEMFVSYTLSNTVRLTSKVNLFAGNCQTKFLAIINLLLKSKDIQRHCIIFVLVYLHGFVHFKICYSGCCGEYIERVKLHNYSKLVFARYISV